ncbi:MAG: hypothetical protein ABIJ35_06525 [Acidobacteriota bacterium]
MENAVKIKPIQIWMTVFTSILIGAMIFGRIFFGPPGFDWTFGSAQILMAAIHLIVLLRTRNWIYLIPTGMYTLWWLTFFPPFAGLSMHTAFAIASSLFLAAFIWLLCSKRINWRYKEILQLAAEPVTGMTNGFTPRPFPTGSAPFTREDAISLARRLKRNIIAFPFIEPDRVVFVIPEYMWAYMLFFKKSYERDTYVAFSNSGQVTVRMAKKDYQKYSKELTFDQLCVSLGDLFKRFMEWHRAGEPKKIFALLNSAGKGKTDGR